MNPFFAFCNAGFKTTLKLFGDQKVEGRENVPKTGSVIFIANHLSNLDPAIVAALTRRDPGFLAKRELFKFPLFAFLLRKYGAFPLNRGTSDTRALRWATERLSSKNAGLILFPEGTRNKNGTGLQKGLPGVTHIALKTGAPVIPIGITGTEPLQNVLKVFVPRARIRIKIGPPFRVTSPSGTRVLRGDLESMTTEVMVRVARLLPVDQHGYYRDVVDRPFVYTEEVGEGAGTGIPGVTGTGRTG